jgi:hypothetical protein
MLAAIYGMCRVSCSFGWPTRPEDYRGTVLGPALERISDGLRQVRGYADFIKTDRVPPCDFYVPDPGFILEFDESQHFTRPRLVTLSLYPPDVRMGFSIDQWLGLCHRIDARDNEPPDRDERRAWYDTLRDLVPPFHGLEPTVRIYSEVFRWCSLDKDSETDRGTFRSLLNLPAPNGLRASVKWDLDED